MRLTRNELIERYPIWNEARHDIVKVFYGDIPLIEWNKAEYERYSQLEGTLANIEAVEAYSKHTVFFNRFTQKKRERILLLQLRACLREWKKPLLWNV